MQAELQTRGIQECRPQSSRSTASTQSLITNGCRCLTPKSTVVKGRAPEGNIKTLDKCLGHTPSSATCLVTLLEALYNVHYMAHRNLRPRMYRRVVLLEPRVFLSRQHQIRVTENRRGERKQWRLETTLDFKHCRLDIILWPCIDYDMILRFFNICKTLRIHRSPFFLYGLVNSILLCECSGHL